MDNSIRIDIMQHTSIKFLMIRRGDCYENYVLRL